MNLNLNRTVTVSNVGVDFKIGSQSSATGNGYFDEGFYIEINGTVIVNFNYLQYTIKSTKILYSKS